MNRLDSLKQAPLVLKVGYPAFVVALLVSMTATFTGNPVWTLPLGVVAVLLGSTLALDLGGGATGLARIARTWKSMGVDRSRSIFATRWYARAFGVLMTVVGVAFLVVALTDR